VESIREAKEAKKAIKLPVTINLGTGKESARHVAFSYTGWNNQTTKYLKSIKKINKPKMDEIMALAKEFTVANTPDGDDDGGSDNECDDDRANIADGSGSSSEEDDDSDF
jgi:hypothetical protein